MSLLVTGSIGIDTVETPLGKARRRHRRVGHLFLLCRLVLHARATGRRGGRGLPAESVFDVFKGRDVDTSGLEIRKGSKTFRWHGSYVKDLNEAVTVEVDLNVLAEQGAEDSRRSFSTANTSSSPTRTRRCSSRCSASLKSPKLIVADTMNLWIQTERAELIKLLKQDPRPGAQRRRSPPAHRRKKPGRRRPSRC